jgi:hypothetical protein
MKDARNRERVYASEMKDFQVKIYTRNDEPEFIQSDVINISETGASGHSENPIEIQTGDVISGVIEGEEFNIKIRYTGTVAWTKETKKGHQFGLEFTEEVLLPDVLIARIMAVA